MTQYPIVLEIAASGRKPRVKATTSVQRAIDGATSLQAELRLIEIDYHVTLSAVRAALACAGDGKVRDPRAYWLAGKHLAEFNSRLEVHGFYLVGKNTTPARHLGLSATSIGRMIAFFHRYPDPFSIDPAVPWSTCRKHREPLR